MNFGFNLRLQLCNRDTVDFKLLDNVAIIVRSESNFKLIALERNFDLFTIFKAFSLRKGINRIFLKA